MAEFALVDWVVVLAYLAVVVAVGFVTAQGQGSQRDYFLGGRQLSWWVVGLSIIATETSALTFIGVPAIAIGALSFDEETGKILMGGGNLFFMLLIVGYVIGRAIIAAYIVPLYFHGDVYTPYQLLTRAFGKEARYTAGFLSFIGIMTGAGVRVFVTAIPVMIVMQTYFEDWNLTLSILVIMIAAMLYTAIGGIKAVVWTDMIQYFIFVGGGLFAVFYVPTLLTGDLAAPSGAEGWGAVREVAGGAGVLDWWNSGFVGTAGAAAILERDPGDLTFMGLILGNLKNLLAGPYNIIMGLIPTTIGLIFAFGFDQLNVQRVLGCPDVAAGRKAIILSAILIFPQFLLFLMIGAVLFSYYQLNGMQFALPPWDPATVDPETGRGDLNGSFVFPIFIVSQIPPLVKGFLVAGILAAAMSSVSSAISAMASIMVMDFYRPLYGSSKDQDTELLISRFTTVIAGILLAVVAWLCMGFSELIALAFTVAGLTAGGILGAFVYGMIVKGGRPEPVVIGMIISFLFMVLLNIAMSKGWIWKINWPWHATIGMAICLSGCFSLRIVFAGEGGDFTKVEADE